METTVKSPWACPKCGRQFARQNQSHSCRTFPLERHFFEKKVGETLFQKFRQAAEARLGAFRIDPVECCIHFVHTSTFLAVRIFKDKIQVEFALARVLDSERIAKIERLSTNRHLYFVDIWAASEIDGTLMDWVEEAYYLGKNSSKMIKNSIQN